MKSNSEKKSYKIAVSSNENYITPHFGHCHSFDIVEIKDGKVVQREKILNPGHDTDFLPKFLSKKGVSYVMAGQIEQEMKIFLNEKGIRPLLGISGGIDDVIESFIKGTLKWRL